MFKKSQLQLLSIEFFWQLIMYCFVTNLLFSSIATYYFIYLYATVHLSYYHTITFLKHRYYDHVITLLKNYERHIHMIPSSFKPLVCMELGHFKSHDAISLALCVLPHRDPCGRKNDGSPKMITYESRESVNMLLPCMAKGLYSYNLEKERLSWILCK